VLEQALKAAVEANSKLTEQITAQRKEIERLRAEVAW
jgi:cell division protein FtsB